MAVNRIDLRTDDGIETLINLTGDTVTKESLVEGVTAHGANGEILVGENPYELNATNETVDEQTDIIDQIKAVLAGKAAGGGGTEIVDAMIDRSVTAVESDTETVGAYVFYGCTKLKNIDLPVATSIGNDAFYNCVSLESVELPNVTSIGGSAFRICRNLLSIDLPSATSIGSNAFRDCKKLQSLILRSETVCTLGTNVFISTPIESGTGYIYVPRALVDSYKSATNWSTYANQFRALEDYTVDGTITGELDESKI